MDPYVITLGIAMGMTWLALVGNAIHAAAVRAETERILRRLHDRDQMLHSDLCHAEQGIALLMREMGIAEYRINALDQRPTYQPPIITEGPPRY